MNGVIYIPPVKGELFKWHVCKRCFKHFIALPNNCLFWIKCPRCGSSRVERVRPLFVE